MTTPSDKTLASGPETSDGEQGTGENITWISRQPQVIKTDRRDRRGSGPLWGGILLLLAGLSGWGYVKRANLPPVFDEHEAHQAVEVAMFLAVEEVEAVRRATGALPDSLTGTLGSGHVSYERLSRNRYRLIGQVDDTTFVRAYVSGDDRTPLDSVVRAMPPVVD